MSVAAPPTTVHIPAGDVYGEVDELFHTFFSHGARAAMLACDEVGVAPFDLHFKPRAAWVEAVQRASHARPVAKNVDLYAAAQLRFNMTERERQQLFRHLFTARAGIVSKGLTDQLWRRREEVLAANGLLRERLADFPLPSTPSDDDAPPGSAETQPRDAPSSTATPAGTSLLQDPAGAKPGATPRSTATSVGSRRLPATVPPPKPAEPTFPALPAPAPIRRRVSEQTLEKEEALLMRALEQLTGHAHRFVAAERKVRRHVEEKKAREVEVAAEKARAEAEAQTKLLLAPRPPGGASRTARGTPARRLGSLANNTTNSASGGGGTTDAPGYLPELLTPRPGTQGSSSGGAPHTSRSVEKEFAALVRTTMARVSQSAIADQRFAALMSNQAAEDPHEVSQRQTHLRRLASSPATHSVSRGVSHVRRPSTDGLPSEEVARMHRERERSSVDRKAATQEEREVTRNSRSERVRSHVATKAVLSSQAGAVRRELNHQNRERALKAAEAHRIAVVEQREKKRLKAAEVQQQRKYEAQQHRRQHTHLESMRKRLAGAVEHMAITGNWDVPEDLRGALDSGAYDATANSLAPSPPSENHARTA